MPDHKSSLNLSHVGDTGRRVRPSHTTDYRSAAVVDKQKRHLRPHPTTRRPCDALATDAPRPTKIPNTDNNVIATSRHFYLHSRAVAPLPFTCTRYLLYIYPSCSRFYLLDFDLSPADHGTLPTRVDSFNT